MMDKIIIDIPFISSVVMNVLLLGVILVLSWYCVKLLKKIYFITDSISAVGDRTKEFVAHLEQVHSLDMYYGDQTIQALIQHSKDLKDFIDDYKLEVMPDDDYSVSDILEEEESDAAEKAG